MVPRTPMLTLTTILVTGQAHTTVQSRQQVTHTAVTQIRRPLKVLGTNPLIIALCIHPAQYVAL